jgi:hypothetical protein
VLSSRLTPEHPNFANVKTLSIIFSLLTENPDSTSTDKGIEITDKIFFITFKYSSNEIISPS